MNIITPRVCRCFRAAAVGISFAIATVALHGQTKPGAYERNFQQPKGKVERALKELQPILSGRLPALEGFATPGDHPLSSYRRGYYQTSVQVVSNPQGGSVVRANAKITAWYADEAAARSGYRVLPSNGRLESDLLEQLTDLLGSEAAEDKSAQGGKAPELASEKSGTKAAATDEPVISAPTPQLSGSKPGLLVGTKPLSDAQLVDTKKKQKPADSPDSALRAEIASLEEVLKNQAHPKNLVAVKKAGTPVVATPSLNGKTLFLASAHDEFEMLDYNADWVHVRISGLSRGWVWRTSLEMPEGISDVPTAQPARVTAADLFRVTREETAPFPGDWEPLRGKNVRIISVEKIQENQKDGGALAKLEYAKSLLEKTYGTLAGASGEVSGVVLIFDSADGGMIAATLPTLQRWKAGTLSDAAMWHQCYFDPPETFSAQSPGGA